MSADPADPPLAGAGDPTWGLFRLPSLYGGNVPSLFTDPITMLSDMLAPFCGGADRSLPARLEARRPTATAGPLGVSPATRGRGEWPEDEPPWGSGTPESPPRLPPDVAAPASATPEPTTHLRPPGPPGTLVPALAPDLRDAEPVAPAASSSVEARSGHRQPAGAGLLESLLPALAPARRAIGSTPLAAPAGAEAAEIGRERRRETSAPDAPDGDGPGRLPTPSASPPDPPGERRPEAPAAADSPPTTQPGAAERPSPTTLPRAAESPSRPVRMVTAAGGLAGVLHAAVANESARAADGRAPASAPDETDRARAVEADDPVSPAETTRPGTGSPPTAGSHDDVEALLDRFAERLEFEVRRAYGEEGPR